MTHAQAIAEIRRLSEKMDGATDRPYGLAHFGEEVLEVLARIPKVFIGFCFSCNEAICTEENYLYYGRSLYHADEDRECIPPDLKRCARCGELEEKRKLDEEDICGPCREDMASVPAKEKRLPAVNE